MSPLNSKVLILRSVLFAAGLYTVFFLPLWLLLLIVLMGSFIFSYYVEGLLFVYLQEALFVFDSNSFYVLALALIIFAVTDWFKKQIRL